MNKRTEEILRRLDEVYGRDIPCYLHYDTPWQLLFSTIMSAQCTDKKVNEVAEKLYKKYPTVQAFADADLSELEEDIHATGFYHNKAKNIKACARRLLDDYGGEVPRAIEELTSLPGVGRKTANVIRGNIYHDPSIVVDTHVGRISRRLGFTEEKDPAKVEGDLMKKIPREHWIAINIQFIALGRSICTARSPKCQECFLSDLCGSCEL
ncbi:MAG: endonuclease III [Lachnospiraceae bacterium]|nr:endonuclease III [Lachnospiraceae bacterium]